MGCYENLLPAAGVSGIIISGDPYAMVAELADAPDLGSGG